MKKIGLTLIVLAVISHILAMDWNDDLTIVTPTVSGFFWGVLLSCIGHTRLISLS